MTIFDQMHLEQHEALYGFTDEVLQRLSDMIDIPLEILREYFKFERPGTVYGAAHATTAVPIIEKAIYHQGAQSITLKISREPGEDTHHLQIEVLEVDHGKTL